MLSKRMFQLGFREALAEELHRKDMTVRDLATRTGIPPATLYKITAGERDPRFSTVKRILEVLEPQDRGFIAVIAAKFILDRVEGREIPGDGHQYRVRGYAANSMDECIVAAVAAEREGAVGIICAPILAPLVEKIVDVPVAIIKPSTDTVEDAMKTLALILRR